MPKNFEDMVRVNKPQRRETPIERDLDADVENKFNSYYRAIQRPPARTRGTKGGSKNGLWFVALLSMLFLFFALSFLFSSAKVTVYPRTKDATLSLTLNATKNTATTDSLSFNTIILSGEEHTVVASSGEKDVSASATGTVIIYNAYSTATQRLDINTRLEGSNGKLYKTVKQVVVPGMKGTTPGAIEVNIYAASAGSEYNSGPLDFKIFGFKGSPKYTKFYARSTGNIAGGGSGTSAAVSDDDKAQATTTLSATLKTELLAKAAAQIPPGFMLFNDAAYLTIDNESTAATASSNQVVLTMTGTLYGFLLNEADLTAKIAKVSLPGYDGTTMPVHIENIHDLTFTLINPMPSAGAAIKDAAIITFGVSGTPHFVWDVDTAKLTSDLAGKRKKDSNDILSSYQAIDSADLVIRPIWKFSFPDDSEKIKINVAGQQ